jgi:hypothetical protein
VNARAFEIKAHPAFRMAQIVLGGLLHAVVAPLLGRRLQPWLRITGTSMIVQVPPSPKNFTWTPFENEATPR